MQERTTTHAKPVSNGRSLVKLACLLAFMAWGCGSKGNSSEAQKGVSSSVQEGPVTLTLTATPKTLDLSKHLSIELEATTTTATAAGPETEPAISIDNYEQKLVEGDLAFELRVVSADTPPTITTDAGLRKWVYHYEIEFALAGEYELPAASLSFRRKNTEAQESTGKSANENTDETNEKDPRATLTTEPLKIVVSDPNITGYSDEELRSIPMPPPVELPAPWPWKWVIAAAGLILVSVLVLRYLFRRRKRREAQIIRIPAHEWAYDQITRLVAEGLVEKGRFQEYFYRISQIVRGYIERRYDVAAPDMTTEEFLDAATTDPRFHGTITGGLDEFLRICDLVKYARHEPGVEECDTILQAARGFVERTRSRLVSIGSETDTGPDSGPGSGASPNAPSRERVA